MSLSTEVSDQSVSGLGSFSTLPAEIRDQIWQQVLLQRHCPRSFFLNGSFRRVSRQISEEISSSFYRRRSLSVCIEYPGEDFEEWPSEFSIKDQSGSVVFQLEPLFLKQDLFFGKYDTDSVTAEFRRIPFRHQQALRIDIAAPRPEDPGELVQSWNKIVFLVNLLSGLELLKLELRFIEQTGRSWASDGKLNLSVPKFEDAMYDSDLEMLLTPFLRLRGLASLSVRTDRITLDGFSHFTIEDLHHRTASSIPFGDAVDIESTALDDEDIQELEDTATAWLDYQVGDLAGRTAALLRVEQYASFSNKSLNAMCDRVFKSWLTGSEVAEVDTSLLCHRRDAVYAFNPLGPWRVEVPRSLRWERRHPNPYAYDSDDERWHYTPAERQGDSREYPFVEDRQRDWLGMYRFRGIPRSSSAEWLRVYEESNSLPTSRNGHGTPFQTLERRYQSRQDRKTLI